MLDRDKIVEILEKARSADPDYELFGASKHKYRLNPPIGADLVRITEERYGFSIPDEYFRFITEIGDGGAGPDYGIEPFADIVKKGKDHWAEEYQEAYRSSLKNAFAPSPMSANEVGNYAIATEAAYEKAPDKYFVYENPNEDALCILNGFYVLGTQGCQWDFGIATTGEMRGSVFVTDNEGAYCLEANNFEEFYQNWLDTISDTEMLKERLQEQRKLRLQIKRLTN